MGIAPIKVRLNHILSYEEKINEYDFTFLWTIGNVVAKRNEIECRGRIT
jgi:hypothetical protein